MAIVHRWQLDAIRGAELAIAPEIADALAQWSGFCTMGRSHNYSRIIAAFLRRVVPAFRVYTFATLSDCEILAYIQMRINSGCKPRTINLDIEMLRYFGSWCIEHGWLIRNPVHRHLHVPVPYTAPRVLTEDEEVRLLAAAAALHDRAYGFVLLLLETGFRSYLACHVRWEHVDIARGEWHIPAELAKSRREYFQPIAPRLFTWLRTHAAPNGYIYGPGARDWWYIIRARSGLPDLKRHDLRRNFVTRCRRSGILVEITMALSDHTDVRTMMAVYRRVSIDDSRGALHTVFGDGSKECSP